MVIGAFVVLIKFCTGILLLPVVITPVTPLGAIADQLNVTFEVVLVNCTAVELSSEQID